MKEIKTEEKETKEDRKKMDDIQAGMKKDASTDKAAKAVISGGASKDSCPACSTPAEKWTGSMPSHIITGDKGPSENVTTTAPKIDPNAAANVKPKKTSATANVTASAIMSSE